MSWGTPQKNFEGPPKMLIEKEIVAICGKFFKIDIKLLLKFQTVTPFSNQAPKFLKEKEGEGEPTSSP